MSLNEILDFIKQYYPRAKSTLSDASIVQILNIELKEIYRQMQINDKHEMLTTADEPSYALPADIRPEDILYLGICDDVTLDKESIFYEYKYLRADQQFTNRNWYIHISDGGTRGIGIYPVPTVSTSHIRILYKKRPTALTLASKTAEPQIEEDWQMLLVYAAIAEIASSGSSPDVEVANNYTYKYNALLTEAKTARGERDVYYHKTKDMFKMLSRSRRYIRNSDRYFEETLTSNNTPNDIMTSSDPT